MMSRRSRSFDSDSGSDSPPRRGRSKRSRGSTGRDRSPYSPPRAYRSPRDDYYLHPHHSSSRAGSYRVLIVTSIDDKVSDDGVKDALYKEFRRFGEVTVRIAHEPDERVAYISYKNADDAHYAKKNKPRIMFYDKPIHVQPVYEQHDHYRGSRRSPSPGEYARLPHGLPPPPADRYLRAYSPGPPPLPHPYDRDPADPYLYPPPAGFPDLPPYDPLLPPLPPGAPLPPPLRRYLPGARGGRYPPDFGALPGIPGLPGGERGGRRSGNKKERFPNYLSHVAPEDDPLACRTLFAGNLEVNISEEELRRIFGRYGKLEDIDIKRPPPDSGNAYAFVRYENLDMAHQAKISLSGQYIGKFMCKVGYGKPVPTTKVWVGGLGDWCNLQLLEKEFDRFGAIKKIDYEKGATGALITYDSMDASKAAVAEMRGFPLGGPGHRIRIDFAHVDGQSDPGKPPPPGGAGMPPRAGSPNRLPPPPGEDFYDEPRTSRGPPPHVRGGARTNYPPELPPHPVPPPMVYDPYDPLLPPVVPRRGGPPLPPPPPHHHPADLEFDHLPRSYRPRSPYDRWSPPPPHMSRSPPSHPGPGPSGSRGGDRGRVDYEGSRLEDIRMVADIEHIIPVSWEGGIILKNSIFATRLHMVRGDRSTIQLLGGVMKIAQRLRLDASKLDDVQRRLSLSPAHAVFVGLPTAHPAPPPPPEDANVQDRPLKHLVGYLKQKDAAGVISLQSSKGIQTGVVYAFPPCHFSFELLRATSPKIIEDDAKDDHVVIVMVTGGI